IVPTGTFLLLHQREDSLQALRNFHDHLVDGGKLIIDILLQTDFTLESVSTRTWETHDGKVLTLESKMIDVDYIAQYTVRHNRYEKWDHGKLINTELERFSLRWYGV